MLLRQNANEGPLVSVSGRVTKRLRARLQKRALQSGLKLSAAIAELLEVALDLEDQLAPFRPAIERLMREENLSVVQAITRLVWMDVELNPHLG